MEPNPCAAASRPKKAKAAARLSAAFNALATEPADRLLTFRQVHALIGSSCKSGHYARALASRGQIRAVRLNSRVVRYSEASVRELLAGKVVT